MSSTVAWILGLIFSIFLLRFLSPYRPGTLGRAMVRVGWGGTRVFVNKGAFVIPGLHATDTLSLTVRILRFYFNGEDALRTSDQLLTDATLIVSCRVQATPDDVLKAAPFCEQGGPSLVFESLFGEELRAQAAKRTQADLVANRVALCQDVEANLSKLLASKGFVLDAVGFDGLQASPRESYNVKDSQGAAGLLETTRQALEKRRLEIDTVQEHQIALLTKNLETIQNLQALQKEVALLQTKTG